MYVAQVPTSYHRLTTLRVYTYCSIYNGCLWLRNVNYKGNESEHAHLRWTYVHTDRQTDRQNPLYHTNVGLAPALTVNCNDNNDNVKLLRYIISRYMTLYGSEWQDNN